MTKLAPEILAKRKSARLARAAQKPVIVTFRMQRRNHETWKWQDVRHEGGFILPEYDADESLPFVEVQGETGMLAFMNSVCQAGYYWRQL